MKILVDAHQFLYMTYLYNYEKFIRDGFVVSDIERNCMKETIERFISIKNKFKTTFDDIIIVFDGGNCWRKEIFPYYKQKRHEGREKSGVNIEKMYNFFNQFSDNMNEIFGFNTIKIHRCEADDVIGTIIRHKASDNSKFVIVSRDHDFIQLIGKNVLLYDFFKLEFVKSVRIFKTSSKEKSDIVWEMNNEDDAKKYLLYMILLGDDGDGIPNVLCDDDVKVNPKKSARDFGIFGPNTIVQQFFTGNPMINKMNLKKIHDKYKENFDRNARLIDLSNVPKTLQKTILKQYEAIERREVVLQEERITKWLEENELHDLCDRLF